MKKTHSDGATGNAIKLGGKIDPNYVIQPASAITFAEGATFKGELIKKGTTFYNDEYVLKTFDLSSSGVLIMIPLPPEFSADDYSEEPSHPKSIIGSDGYDSEDDNIDGVCPLGCDIGGCIIL